MSQQLQTAVDAAWERREIINSATKGEVREAVETAIAGLDDGSSAPPRSSATNGSCTSG